MSPRQTRPRWAEPTWLARQWRLLQQRLAAGCKKKATACHGHLPGASKLGRRSHERGISENASPGGCVWTNSNQLASCQQLHNGMLPCSIGLHHFGMHTVPWYVHVYHWYHYGTTSFTIWYCHRVPLVCAYHGGTTLVLVHVYHGPSTMVHVYHVVPWYHGTIGMVREIVHVYVRTRVRTFLR